MFCTMSLSGVLREPLTPLTYCHVGRFEFTSRKGIRGQLPITVRDDGPCGWLANVASGDHFILHGTLGNKSGSNHVQLAVESAVPMHAAHHVNEVALCGILTEQKKPHQHMAALTIERPMNDTSLHYAVEARGKVLPYAQCIDQGSTCFIQAELACREWKTDAGGLRKYSWLEATRVVAATSDVVVTG